MSALHTPGPWECQSWDNSDDGYGVIAVRNDVPAGGTPTRGMVAYVSRREFDRNEASEANARLIAAAPDLLDALRSLLLASALVGGDLFEVIQARAAIAKATGVAP